MTSFNSKSPEQRPPNRPPNRPESSVGMSGGLIRPYPAGSAAGSRVIRSKPVQKNWDEDDGHDYCTGDDDLADAQAVKRQARLSSCISANFCPPILG